MKKTVFLVLIITILFLGCDTGSNGFTSTTNDSVLNTVEILGIVGLYASSSNNGVAVVGIENNRISITSVSAGTAIITVTDGTNNASINITVTNTGSITIRTIVKYTGSEESTIVGHWVSTMNIDGKQFVIGLVLNEDKTFYMNTSYPIPSGTYEIEGNTITLNFLVNPPPPENNMEIVTINEIVLDFIGLEFSRYNPTLYSGTWVSNQYLAQLLVESNNVTLQLKDDEFSPWVNAGKGLLFIDGNNVTLAYTHIWKNGDWTDEGLGDAFGINGVLGEENPMHGTVTGYVTGSIMFDRLVKE